MSKKQEMRRNKPDSSTCYANCLLI